MRTPSALGLVPPDEMLHTMTYLTTDELWACGGLNRAFLWACHGVVGAEAGPWAAVLAEAIPPDVLIRACDCNDLPTLPPMAVMAVPCAALLAHRHAAHVPALRAFCHDVLPGVQRGPEAGPLMALLDEVPPTLRPRGRGGGVLKGPALPACGRGGGAWGRGRWGLCGAAGVPRRAVIRHCPRPDHRAAPPSAPALGRRCTARVRGRGRGEGGGGTKRGTDGSVSRTEPPNTTCVVGPGTPISGAVRMRRIPPNVLSAEAGEPPEDTDRAPNVRQCAVGRRCSTGPL